MFAIRHHFVLVLALAVLPAAVRAQSPAPAAPAAPAAPVPGVTAPSPTAAPNFQKAQTPPADTTYAKEPYVFELIQQKYRYEADGRYQRDLTLRVRIQSESAVHDFGLLVEEFASAFESLDVVYARVRKPDGTVIETPASDVQELDSAVSREAPMYTDEREKHVAIKSLSVGDVLEVSFRWNVHDAMAPNHFWLDSNYSRIGICLKETIEIDVPRATPVKLHYTDPKPIIRDQADRRIYTFENSNLKDPEESKIPDWDKNAHGFDPPDLSLSSFASWEDVGAWFSALQQPKIAVTPEIKAKAEELTKGKSTDDEKISALYDFVSLHIRYIAVNLGLSRYTPHAAADVLSNRYGDCKDKHTLFAALLQAVGIPAAPVLISSIYRVDPAFASPGLFDHVITAIPRGDSFEFLDTTPEVAPLGLLTANLRGRQALVIRGSGPAKLVFTPADPPFPQRESYQSESTIDPDGTLDAKVRLEERGDTELLLRATYRAVPQNRWQELTQKIVAGMGFGGTVADVSVAQPEDTAHPFWITYSYHRKDYSEWENKRIVLPVPLGALLRDLNDDQKGSKAVLPLGSPMDVVYESKVKFPTGYAPILPENVQRKTDFVEFSATYSVDNAGVLDGLLHLKTLMSEIPGDKRQEYSGLVKSADDAAQAYIRVRATAEDFAAPSLDGLTPFERKSVVVALAKQFAATPGDHQFALALSQAYMDDHRYSDAAGVLEKSLAANSERPEGLELALAKAYFGIPEADKGMDQLHKVMGEHPDHWLLNNAAWVLADANTHLSEALAYSRQAVSEISARSAAVSPDVPRAADFGLLGYLAANWDTLGWIQFRSGDALAAEKYLIASWQLRQVPMVGEHLVEVYEKLGKNKEAAKVAEMAIASSGPDAPSESLSKQMPHLRAFLPRRTGGPSIPNASLYKGEGDAALSEMRSIRIPFHPHMEKSLDSANFVISFVASSKPEKVVFGSGTEELRGAIPAMTAASYPQTVPDDTPVRILRLATLNCSQHADDCVVILMPEH